MVPIFGLPIFFIGYPRPARQWPKFGMEKYFLKKKKKKFK